MKIVSVPPWTRGDFRGFLDTEPTHPGAARPLSLRATPPTEGIFRGAMACLFGLG